MITKGPGSYTIKTLLADPLYKSAPVTNKILVKGTKFSAKNMYVSGGSKTVYSVKLVNEENKAVKNSEVVFTFNGKNSTSVTNSDGIAKVNLGVLSKGTHKVSFSHDSAQGSAKIFVANKVTIKNILKASKTVKNYISKHKK